MALDEERTRVDGDLKKVFVKFSDDPECRSQDSEASFELCTGRETRGIELCSRMWWVPIQPSSIGNLDKASSHGGGEAQCGLMMVTQWKRCRERSLDEVQCRVVNEASLKQVVA